MRVLHILEATSGGTRRHVLDVLPELQSRGAQCSLIYSSLRNPSFHRDATHLADKNIETHEIPMGHRWSRGADVTALRALHAHLGTYHYDLIHCHSSNAGLLGRLANAARSRSTPLIYTPHYIAFGAGLPRAQRRAALYLEKMLVSQTAYFIAVSRHEYSLLQRVLKIDSWRASVIYNGVDISNVQSSPHSSSLVPHPFVIGCFGRLTTQKNQTVLIRALPLILEQIPNAQLKLVGSGEDESTLRALAGRLGCDDRVHFCGEILDPQSEYLACDVVAQPSRWEGCSYAILEAMSAARAVLASARGGNPEVIGAAGVLCAPGDANQWAHEIIALARDEVRRGTLGETARTRVAEHFRLETMIEKTLAVYEKVLR